jgi:putative SOS response-associated peptidase YedK
MCGRYSLTIDQESLAAALEVDRVFSDHHPRWNVAPSQEAPVVRDDGEGWRLDDLRWGLVPWWADNPSVGNRHINARCETVAVRRPFRDPFLQGRRCLVPVDGFYEWRKDPGGKTPHWIARPDHRIFTLAGVWERWKDGSGGQVRSFAILTTDSNARVAPIHDRMPVVIPPEARGGWLDPATEPGHLQELLHPPPERELQAWPVSTLVNRPANDGPELLEGVPGAARPSDPRRDLPGDP